MASSTGMKQRCWVHDYCAPSFYMITVVTEPRRNCLSEVGEVQGLEQPLTLSPLGEIVQEVWQRTNGRYPGVEACECVVMPDHFHGILWVKEPLKRHVGHIIKAFKRVSEQECRGKGLLGSQGCRGKGLPGSQGCRGKGLPLPRNPGSVSGAAPAGSVSGAAPAPASLPSLWETGYQDTILLRRGQLQTMGRYIADNPRRLATKRANPQLFTVVQSLTVAPGRQCPGLGNLFLLDYPVKRQVQVSRRITPEALADKKEELLYAAKHGAVLVSPCISPGEREIARAALAAGLPLIVILANGFAPLYKPPGHYFDACANGRLLMLAPLPYQREKHPITRDRCLHLNEWANAVVDPEQQG